MKTKNKKAKKIILTLIIIIGLITSLGLYARFIGTSGLTIKEYKITSIKIPQSFHGTKIIHFSDVHYGRTIKKAELENIVKKINSTNPDLIFFTGDFFDKDIKLTDKMIDEAKNILLKLKANLGMYAVKGNHDYYFEKFDLFIAESGFILLENSYDFIYNKSNEPILINGVLGYLNKKADIKKALTLNEGQSYPSYIITLVHEPDYTTTILKEKVKPNLIMAGHSHNGQVRLPLIGAIIKPKGAKKYFNEYYKIDSSKLYISSGIGVSTINARLFNKPSINLYRLTIK